MKHSMKMLVPILVALATIVVVFSPLVALAQGPCDTAVITYDFSGYEDGWDDGEWVQESGYIRSDYSDGYAINSLTVDELADDVGYEIDTITSTDVVMTVTTRVDDAANDVAFGYCRVGGGCDFLNDRNNTSWQTWVYTFAPGYEVDFFFFDCEHTGTCYVDDVEIYIPCTSIDYGDELTGTIQTCTTIPDWHFSGDYTDTWTLSGGATLSTSIVTLPDGGAVSQTLNSLVPNKTYNLLVSVSTISPTPTLTDPVTLPLLAELGDTTATLSITGTDVFTASGLDTGIGYIYDFVLTNTALISSQINIDWACLYDMGDADEDIVCIAPTNGEFNTADDWAWYYNAEWNQSGQNAYLPYNDTVSDTGKSLVVSTGTYSLPELVTDTYLILAFDSMALGQDGVVSARAGDSWHEFDVTGSLYRYEADISAQAGLSATTVSFVNSGAPDGEFSAIDDLAVDNVCIYVSDTPPNIPEPINPWFSPFSFGFNFTCPDVPALLAGYNIDVYTPTAAYQAGVASWTEENWVPWLVGALWVNVGSPLSCFIVEFMRLVAAIAEQLINNFTNMINWNYETLVGGVPWLQNGMFYPAMYGGYWLTWYANNSGYGLIEQQNVMSQNTMDVGLETGSAINQIMNDLIWIWNESILGYMNITAGVAGVIPAEDPSLPTSPWWSVWDAFMWLINMVASMVELFWSLLTWLAEILFAGAMVPVEAYNSFVAGVQSSAATVDVACTGSNFWCYFWAGVQMINQTVSHTVIYTVVIVFMIIASIVIVLYNLHVIFEVKIG